MPKHCHGCASIFKTRRQCCSSSAFRRRSRGVKCGGRGRRAAKGTRMSQSQRGRRWAGVGLAVALLALTTLSIVGAASTRHSADLVRRSASLAEDYNSAHSAVAAEESLERKYRLEPSPEVRGLHRQAEADLHAALAKINAEGTAADRHTVEVVNALHVSYAEAIIRMFAAVDAGDTPKVLKIDNDEVDPSFG